MEGGPGPAGRGVSPDLAALGSRSDEVWIPIGRLAGRDGSDSQSRSDDHDPLTRITRMDRRWGTSQPILTRRVARAWW